MDSDCHKEEGIFTMPGQDIHATLALMKQIRERIAAEEEQLETLERTLQQYVDQGVKTGDAILDIVLQYGTPHKMRRLERNLRRIDDQIRRCSGQVILLQVIQPPNVCGGTSITYGRLPQSSDQPTMTISRKEGMLRIEISTISGQRIQLSDDIIEVFIQEDRPSLSGLIQFGGSFRLVIDNEEKIRDFLSDDSSMVGKNIREDHLGRLAVVLARLK